MFVMISSILLHSQDYWNWKRQRSDIRNIIPVKRRWDDDVVFKNCAKGIEERRKDQVEVSWISMVLKENKKLGGGADLQFVRSFSVLASSAISSAELSSSSSEYYRFRSLHVFRFAFVDRKNIWPHCFLFERCRFVLAYRYNALRALDR
ncbi:unnamed protein product [Wuchereria bancrofti]|uniref:Uncharacterized protein n=1 Tax=Wuchereria bancrofti TaxID=6293 RepID=A0A3P7F3M1_WUCBA|nr:unnamed protein product [Wuchereria bancrofti]